MTFDERINIIERQAEINKQEKKKVENKLRKEKENCIKEFNLLKTRIKNIITIANKCVKHGVELPKNTEKEGYTFYTNYMYHNLGFYQSYGKKIKYIGFCGGGFCGIYNFVTDGKTFWLRNINTASKSKEVGTEYLYQFIKQFPEFESAFYKWIDSMKS